MPKIGNKGDLKQKAIFVCPPADLADIQRSISRPRSRAAIEVDARILQDTLTGQAESDARGRAREAANADSKCDVVAWNVR